MPSDTLRLRACVGPKSIDASPVIPNLSFSWVRMCASSALRSSALDGMQPDVEADAAPVLVLDDGDALAELGGADGGDVPTGAGTEDDDVEVLAHGPRAYGVAPPRDVRTKVVAGHGLRGRSDRDELDGADGVAGQDRARDLRVGAERRGHGDRAGLERELGGPVRQRARAPGTASRRRCAGGPRRGTAGRPRRSPGERPRRTPRRSAACAWSPTAGRAGRRPGWRAGRRSRPRRAPARRARGPGRRSARRAAAGRAPRGTPSPGRARAVARIRRSSWRAVGLGDRRGHVDLGVVGLGQQQRHDDDLVVPGLARAGRRPVAKDGLASSRNAGSMRRSGRMRADLVDEGLDRLGRAGVAAAVGEGHQGGSGHGRGLLSGGRARRRCRSSGGGSGWVMRGCRTRSCRCRPSGRCAGPRPARRGGCTASSRSTGSRRTAAG